MSRLPYISTNLYFVDPTNFYVFCMQKCHVFTYLFELFLGLRHRFIVIIYYSKLNFFSFPKKDQMRLKRLGTSIC